MKTSKAAKSATPPKTRTASTPKPKKSKARTAWKPATIAGCDVRLYRATYYDDDGDEIERHGVPAIDPNYHFNEAHVRELAWAVWPHDNEQPWHAPNWTPCLITGPKGSGKTSLISQVAARMNIPVYRVNLNVGTTVRHLKGRIGAEPGRTVFVAGVATAAAEAGGWLILDEFSAISPPVSMALFPILEPEGEVLLEDAQPPRYVRRHPAFRIFATDNALGNAQENDRFSYAGTNADANEALLDRFGAFIEVSYMNKEDEASTVAAKVAGIDGDTLEGMIRVADSVRQSREVAGGFSFRMLIDWARRVSAGQVNAKGKRVPTSPDNDNHVLEAAQGAFLRRQKSSVEKQAIVEVIRRLFVIDGRDS